MAVLVICVVIVALGAWWLTRTKPVAAVPLAGQSGEMTGIPAGKEELFDIGTHPGEDGVPVMYTLTTCRHCVHLKDFLDRHNINFHLVYVDDFESRARMAMMDVLRSRNPRGSFPTLVVPGGTVVVGFRESQVRAALGLPEQEQQ